MSVDELLLQCNRLWILGKQFSLLTKWMLDTLLVTKWGIQMYGLSKFSEPFLLKSKLIWGSYGTRYLVCSKIKPGLAQSSCHISGKGKDMDGSLLCLSYHTQVLNFFSSIPSPIAFPTCLYVALPAAWYCNQYSWVISMEPGDLGSLVMNMQAGKTFGPILLILTMKR